MVDALLHHRMLEGRAAMLAHDVAGSRQRQAQRRGQIRCGDGPVVVERDEFVDAVRERVAAAREGAEVGGGDDETGRCLSSEFMPQAAARLVLTCLNMGQAAGSAVAQSLEEGVAPRKIDVKRLQATLAKDRA